MSKPSALEIQHLSTLKWMMETGELSSIVSGKPAEELHHPLGGFWETGKGLKAHHWFVIPLTMHEHRQYHLLGRDMWERIYGDHQTLLIAFWEELGFKPGSWMLDGMDSRRAAWLTRVLAKLEQVIPAKSGPTLALSTG